MKIPERYKDAKYEDAPEHVRQAFEQIRQTRKGLYLYGKVGSGKTHIAYSLLKNWRDEGRSAIFWNTTNLLREIKADFDRVNSDKMFVEERITDSQALLFLDDIGSEKMTDFVAEVFYRIVNHRYNEMIPVIFTSNLPISELADKVGDRVASRIMEMCDVFELEGEDRRLN